MWQPWQEVVLTIILDLINFYKYTDDENLILLEKINNEINFIITIFKYYDHNTLF